MKKFFVPLLVMGLALGLTACASDSAEDTVSQPAATEEVQTAEEIMAASQSDAAAIAATPPASHTDAVVDEAAYAAAQEYIGRTVEELYEAIGEPTGGSQYAASCAEENAEDGMLFYDGFYVWSLRSEEQEIVHDVYLMD